MKLILSKTYFDPDIQGKFFDSSHYTFIAREDIDVYTSDKVLFKFRKSAIPKEMGDEMYNTFIKHADKLNNQRASASGGKRPVGTNRVARTDKPIRSNIAGYFDRPKILDKKHFNTQIVCRQTAFTRDNIEKWKNTIPFFELISNYYKLLAPEEYHSQIKSIKSSPYSIGSTPFTTITVNHNFRTACHKDSGDYKDGLGNLVVLGHDFIGGFLGFPEYKIAVDIQPGDLLIMDVHEYHCNTQLNEGSRLSFVCYLREDMMQCNASKEVNGEVMHYKKL